METPPRRPKAEPHHGHYRYPERQDYRTRGPRGKDPLKEVNGRKRHLVVDTSGLIIAAVVRSAGIQEQDGTKEVMNFVKVDTRVLKSKMEIV